MPQKSYLGGHLDITNTDKGALSYLVGRFKVETLLDVGCGPMGVVQDALDMGIDAYGVDGDIDILYKEGIPTDRLSIHDFVVNQWRSPIEFDCVWSVDVSEHIDEEYVWNYIRTISDNLKLGGVLFFTHGFPGQGGYNHVNCKFPEYWIDKFKEVSMHLMEEETKAAREAAVSPALIQWNGNERIMIFIKGK